MRLSCIYPSQTTENWSPSGSAKFGAMARLRVSYTCRARLRSSTCDSCGKWTLGFGANGCATDFRRRIQKPQSLRAEAESEERERERERKALKAFSSFAQQQSAIAVITS